MKLYFNKIIEFTACAIKCDAEECDYKLDDIGDKKYIDFLGRPCPKCGSVLLTEEDLKVLKGLEFIAKWFGWVRVPSLSPPTDVHLDMNGSGTLKIEKIGIRGE